MFSAWKLNQHANYMGVPEKKYTPNQIHLTSSNQNQTMVNHFRRI